MQFKVKAAFSKNGGASWFWLTWTENKSGGNKHAAIIAKANEIGANSWDYGNADYAFACDANF